ncbi:MAG: hypothetical protein KKH92_10975 [Firmicutes bacterium]|nr:hypothetical protein [Bacillota bacterium]
MSDMNLVQIINGRTVEFIHETHEYFIDGIKVPSVTQVVAAVLPNQYKDIDKAILKQAADKGIALHREIENYEKDNLKGYTQEFNNYLYLKRMHQFQPIENEVLIYIELDGIPLCAGRLDMIITSKEFDGIGIGDVKRTANIHFEHLKLQLNLYALGYEQSYSKKINFLKCIHLRYSQANYLNISLDLDYAIEKIKEFHN